MLRPNLFNFSCLHVSALYIYIYNQKRELPLKIELGLDTDLSHALTVELPLPFPLAPDYDHAEWKLPSLGSGYPLTKSANSPSMMHAQAAQKKQLHILYSIS